MKHNQDFQTSSDIHNLKNISSLDDIAGLIKMNTYQVETFNTEKEGPGTSTEKTIRYMREGTYHHQSISKTF